MDRYLKSAALVATSNTMALAATVIGFDIVELWSGERSSCVYVHASERILEAYAVTTGLYPTDRVHVLSPRLCDQARNSPNGYYWHVLQDGEEKIPCFGSQAQTEVAFMLAGEDGCADVFLVGFAMDKIRLTSSKAKFLSGLCYAITVAAFDMEEDEVADAALDVKAGIARERLRYISKFVRREVGGEPLVPANESHSDDSRELQFALDGDGENEFYVPMDRLPLLLVSVPVLDLSQLKDIAHMADGSNSNIYTAVFGGSSVVLKMLKKEAASDDVALLEYEAELGLLCRVAHPNIVRVLGRGHAPRKFLVLEHLSGGTLSATQSIVNSSHGASRSALRKPTYTYDALLKVIKDIAEALNYLHGRNPSAVILHRDLKPDNVGFTASGVVKIFDFGLAAVVRRGRRASEAFEMTGNTGSLRYMAPEVALSKPYNEKVDVYSFGVMAWQLASDRVPFKGMSREQFQRDVIIGGQRPKLDSSWPMGFRKMLETCWHEDYQRRPSFAFILDDLKTLMRSSPWLAVASTGDMPDYNI